MVDHHSQLLARATNAWYYKQVKILSGFCFITLPKKMRRYVGDSDSQCVRSRIKPQKRFLFFL